MYGVGALAKKKVAAGGGGALLLDGLPAAAVALSVNERLKTSYTGALARALRTADSTEQDIPYIVGSNLVDQPSLATFGNTSNCTWKTLYDQGGSSRDFTQPTTTKQAAAYTGGSPGTARKNGANVIAVHDGIDDWFSATSSLGVAGGSGITVFMLAKMNAIAAAQGMFDVGIDGHDFALINANNTTIQGWVDGDTGDRSFPTTNTNAYHYDIVTISGNSNTIAWRQNGAALTASATNAHTNSITNGNPGAWIGIYRGLDGPANMSWSTIIVWPSVLSAPDIATLEAWAETRRVL